MRNVMVGLLLLACYATSSFASLPDTPLQAMFDRADLVFVGQLMRVENENADERSALLETVFTVKGEYAKEIRLCNDKSQEKLGVGVIGKDIQVYFFEKRGSCYFGAFGYKSVVYVKKNTNCIFAEFAYPGKEMIGVLEPLELFIKKLLGKDVVPGFPEILRAEKCE